MIDLFCAGTVLFEMSFCSYPFEKTQDNNWIVMFASDPLKYWAERSKRFEQCSEFKEFFTLLMAYYCGC